MSNVTWLLRLLDQLWTRALGITCLSLAASLLVLADPLILKWIIDKAIPTGRVQPIAMACAGILVVHVFRFACQRWAIGLTGNLSQVVLTRLRMQIMDHSAVIGIDYHERTPMGARTFVLTKASDEISILIADVIPGCVRATVLIIAVLAVISYSSWQMAAMLLPIVPAYLFAIYFSRKELEAVTEDVGRDLLKWMTFVQEYLAGAIQINVLHCHESFTRQAQDILADIRRKQGRRIMSDARLQGRAGVLALAGTVMVLFYGAWRVQNGALTLGTLVLCYSFFYRLLDPIGTVAELYSQYKRASPSITAIRQFMRLEPSLRDVADGGTPLSDVSVRPSDRDGQGLSPTPAAVSLIDATFSYQADGPLVVSHCNLTIGSGECVALVGMSGEGKSSVAKLMARLYDPQTGTVQSCGRDVRNIPIEQLRKRVHYMPQTPILFSGSTVDNLRYADPRASREYIWMALEAVGLAAAIKELPATIDEDLGPGANRLSGGERQRLALARAIIAQPRVLILDESTAFLDAPIERQIYTALRETLVATTLVVITHRVSTITWADRMVLIDSGRVVAEGTHRTLYDSNPEYRHMVDQLVQGATEVGHR